MSQLALFDYNQLDPETCTIIQQEDKEYDRNMGESGTSFIYACKNLQRIHAALKYKRPGFVEYCNSKPGLSWGTAHKMLNVAKMLLDSDNINIDSKEALYLLAASSTPDEARVEAIERAQNGETITHAAAKEIVNGHTPPTLESLVVPHPSAPGWDAVMLDDLIDFPPKGYNYLRDNRRSQVIDIYTPSGMDACQTPAYALDPLLPYLQEGWHIWEPAAGEGYLEGALYDSGFSVIPTDILTGKNFFQFEPENWNCLITNPPYSIVFLWLDRCYWLGKPFALLLKVDILGTKTAQKLFDKYGVEVIFVNPRISFKMPNKGWDSSATFPTAWFTFGLNIGRQMTFAEVIPDGTETN